MVTLTVERHGEADGASVNVTTYPSPRQVRDAIERMSTGLFELHLEQASGAVLSIASESGSYFLAFFEAGDRPYYQALGSSSGATARLSIGGVVMEMEPPYLLPLDVAIETALALLRDDRRPGNVKWERLA